MDLCPICNKVHQRDGVATCIGHRSDREPCLAYPIKGGTVCYKRHGGSAPQVQAAAQARLHRRMAERVVVTYGLPQDIEPVQAITGEIARTCGHVLWLGELIAEMEPIDLVWGQTMEEEGSGTGQREGDTTKSRSEAQLSMWLVLYKDERKHLVDVSKAAIQCGIAEREIRLLEQQGQIIADFLRAFIDDPELDFDQVTRRKMREVASRHLRVLAA